MERDNVQKSEQRQAIALFAVVVLASSVGNLAQTGLNAMLSSICAEFGIVEGVGQWLTTSYMLVLGIVVPLSSYFMGRFRLKDLTLLAIALFAVGALVSAAASNFAMLFAGRLAQAVAAGMLLPLVQTIAMTRFPDGRKATAMGISGIAMGFAPNVGPTIGGAMVEGLGWRSFFWLLVALTVVVGIACQFAVKRRDDASYPAGFDVLSFALSAFGFGGLLMGASEVSSYSFIHPFVWAPLIAGAVCLFAFAKRQRSLENPLVDLAIFDNREFVDGFWALNCLFASFMGITLLVPLYIEGLCGGSAMQAGLVLLPGTVAALIANPLAGLLVDKIGARPVTLFFGACLVMGSCLMVTCDASTPLWAVCAMQGVRAMGVSGLIGPLIAWSLSGLRGRQISDGSGFGTAARQACASIGCAGMVFFACGGALAGEVAFHAAFGLSAAFSLACFAIIALRVK